MKRGFSLIEVLIVLSILGTVMLVALNRPRNHQKTYKRFFRKLSVMSKQIKNRAKIEQATYRMAFLLQLDRPPTITIEKKEGTFLKLSEKETKEQYSDLFKDRIEKSKKKKEKDKKGDGFKTAKQFNIKALNPPQDLDIVQVEVAGLSPLKEQGFLAFYYFPHGLVEQTAIQIKPKNLDLKWTLVTDAVSGEIYTFSGHKELKDFEQK